MTLIANKLFSAPRAIEGHILTFYLAGRLSIAAAMTFAVASCTTTPADFRKNPKAVSKAALCRTYLDTYDDPFRQEIALELGRRGITPYECPAMVQKQNQAIAATVAIAAIGTAVAVCANHNCGGGSYYPSYPRYRPYQEIANMTGSVMPRAIDAEGEAHIPARAAIDFPGMRYLHFLRYLCMV
ncbi:hypothetical protein [Sinorhizobium psoraleae]|uniref:Lipoprotein n=1 Tax=Sinorhizobium psoraleae TaxID=520838 RepID=A0ABT4KN58_9HYPH|nr:hypothetical protein [Sinorhizobium psoraleae]MCZ4093396.1 hypothetical protein [Sinorhizobium psoraleae]